MSDKAQTQIEEVSAIPIRKSEDGECFLLYGE